ncbi:unnamed protein product [Amoebophrya sp. A120]|nr:unnamed protein product [Amoebophrya sp. A120]|eukprot:GSA120T00002896001.1
MLQPRLPALSLPRGAGVLGFLWKGAAGGLCRTTQLQLSDLVRAVLRGAEFFQWGLFYVLLRVAELSTGVPRRRVYHVGAGVVLPQDSTVVFRIGSTEENW